MSQSSDLKSFTETDDFGVNIMFLAIVETIKENYMKRSSNFVGTWAHFVESLRGYFNDLKPNDPTSKTFVLTDEQRAEIIRLTAGMGLQSIMYHDWGAWEQYNARRNFENVYNNLFKSKEGVLSYNSLRIPQPNDQSIKP